MKRKYKLLENALDSLEVGIDFYLNEKKSTAHKHAILNLFHSIELLMKERVLRIDEQLLFIPNKKNPKTKPKTIGIDDILKIFEEEDIQISKHDLLDLEFVRNKRNDIVHFEFHQDNGDVDTLARLLKFIKVFLSEHLELELSELIDSGMYEAIEEIVDSFEERYHRAIQAAKDLVEPRTKHDLADPRNLAECPDCNTDTLACTGDPEVRCALCKFVFTVKQCERCARYQTNVDEMGFCSECFEQAFGRF